jgi:hypothetical protein
MKNLSKFVLAYLECALWSSTEEDETPMDKNHTISDFSEEAIAKAESDCANFQAKAGDLLSGYPSDQAGHDFWLTRNRHGAGFWDRGGKYTTEENERKLTDIAHSMGETWIYTGDDGLIYFM